VTSTHNNFFFCETFIIKERFGPGGLEKCVRITSSPCRCCNDTPLMAIVVAPDVLMSPTSIVSSLSCERSTVLSYSVESSGMQHPSAVLGSLKHEVFEAALVNCDFTRDFLRSKAKDVVHNNFQDLISVGLSFDAALLEIKSVIEGMVAWGNTYLDRTKFKLDQGNQTLVDVKKNSHQEGGYVFAEHVEDAAAPSGLHRRRHALITSVVSTEEMVASTVWGMKGFVDACLEVRFTTDSTTKRMHHTHALIHSQKQLLDKNGVSTTTVEEGRNRPQTRVVPFELKTGKKKFKALEHQAQLMLYTLLMRERQGRHPEMLARAGNSGDDCDEGKDSGSWYPQNGWKEDSGLLHHPQNGWKIFIAESLCEGLLLYLDKEERLPMECILSENQCLVPLLLARNTVAACIAFNDRVNVMHPPPQLNVRAKHAQPPVLCLPNVIRDTRTCSYCHNKTSCAMHLKSFDIEDCANEVCI
jgi:hypothetical protein